jgi:hypothetical protein
MPYSLTFWRLKRGTPFMSILLAIERSTLYMSILLAVERHTPHNARLYSWHIHRQLLMALLLLYNIEKSYVNVGMLVKS